VQHPFLAAYDSARNCQYSYGSKAILSKF